MEKKSRTEYSAVNTTVAMAARIAAILAGYLTRVVFTRVLSEDYVGINGLFTDILNVLALSELGVGTAVTYALYRPISEGDTEKLKSLMYLYRKFYRIVAFIVLAAGLLVIPFLDVLIRDQPEVDHLILIYLMYLFNSVISYLLIYKRTLIDAHQMSYIGVLYQTVFLILQNVVQMAVLIITGNFFLFLSALILCTVGGNYAISRKADRLYPYLKEKEVRPLPQEERRDIHQNIRAMLTHKIGNVLVNNTDNLLLSALAGTLNVGRYSNYYLIIGSVRQVLNQVFQGITASVGNLGVEESKERTKRIFESAFFVGQWMFGLTAICLFEVLDSFVELSFGAKYIFTRDVTLVLCLNFYLTGMRQATLVFRDSMGIFKYDRYKAIPEALINLAVSIILGRMLGTVGVFLGTLVSTAATSLWVEPCMLYKYRLEISSRPYFLHYFLYAAVTFTLWFLEDLLCRRITGAPPFVCILRLIVCILITNAVFLLLYHRTGEFRMLRRKALGLLQKRLPGFPANKKKEYTGRDITPEQGLLLRLLDAVLTGKKYSFPEKDVNWEKLCDLAKKHGVWALLYEAFKENPAVPSRQQEETVRAARVAVQQSYRILFLCKYLVGCLEAAGIPVVVLKGVGTASFYSVPELRKTGDVDLLLMERDSLKEAENVLGRCRCELVKEQFALHHVVYRTPEGIEVELHTMLVEPFDNHRINRYLEECVADCMQNVLRADCMGVTLPILDMGYHAYELLMHMLQHFLRSGFGLRLLCDWVVLWNRETAQEEREKYLSLIQESGVRGFSDMVTIFCCTYLGLGWEKVEWMEITVNYDVKSFRREILEAEEFGKSTKDRMVIMRGDGIGDYIREFHHQMCLSFPRGSRHIFCWPALWVVTLVRFLHNNRKIRRVSARSILKKAGQRSRVMEQIGLWK